MPYLIAVLGDRPSAESAYMSLEQEVLGYEALNIVGRGFRPAEEFAFLNPKAERRRRMIGMALWTIPFGFVSGLAFSIITGLQTFAWAGELGNQLLGGLLGAISGGMGAMFIGSGLGVPGSRDDSDRALRNRLDEGKFLLIAEGPEPVLEKVRSRLRPYDPESFQWIGVS
jgi:hypothetical protein